MLPPQCQGPPAAVPVGVAAHVITKAQRVLLFAIARLKFCHGLRRSCVCLAHAVDMPPDDDSLTAVGARYSFDPRFLTVFKSNMNAGNQNLEIDK